MTDKTKKQFEALRRDILKVERELIEALRDSAEAGTDVVSQLEQYVDSCSDASNEAYDVEMELEDLEDADNQDEARELIELAQTMEDSSSSIQDDLTRNRHGIEPFEVLNRLDNIKLAERRARRVPRNNTSFKEGRTYYAVSSLAGTDKRQWNKVRVIERTGNKMLVSEFIEHRNLWAEPTTVYVEKTNRGNEVAKFDMFSKLSSMHEAEGVKTKAAPTSQVTLNKRHF